jgi:hypothetical protein
VKWHDKFVRPVSWLRELDNQFSLQRSEFNPRAVHVGFVVGKVVLWFFSMYFHFSLLVMIPLLHIYIRS